MESILVHQITTDGFFERVRAIIKEEIKLAMQQDQLLTKEGALKMAGLIARVISFSIINNLVRLENAIIVKQHLQNTSGCTLTF